MSLELSHFLESHKDSLSPLLILTHDYPDPDALASAFALQHLAELNGGIKSRIVYGAVIGRIENQEMVRLLKIPAHKIRPSDFRKHASVALVDTQPGFDNNSFPRGKNPSIIIDQHVVGPLPDADFKLINTDAGATSMLLARELLDLEVEIPVRLATALVYGILSDTLDFYRTAKQETVDTYMRLVPSCDVHMLAHIQNPSRPRKFFRDLARCIARSRIRQKLLVSHLGEVDNPDLVAQMADFLMACEGMQWTFCTGRHGENLHVSLRTSNREVEAGPVLRDIVNHPRHAGGHGQIAGGRFRVGKSQGEEVWEKTEMMLTERLVNRLHLRSNTEFQSLVDFGISKRTEG